MDLHSILNVY